MHPQKSPLSFPKLWVGWLSCCHCPQHETIQPYSGFCNPFKIEHFTNDSTNTANGHHSVNIQNSTKLFCHNCNPKRSTQKKYISLGKNVSAHFSFGSVGLHCAFDLRYTIIIKHWSKYFNVPQEMNYFLFHPVKQHQQWHTKFNKISKYYIATKRLI